MIIQKSKPVHEPTAANRISHSVSRRSKQTGYSYNSSLHVINLMYNGVFASGFYQITEAFDMYVSQTHHCISGKSWRDL